MSCSEFLSIKNSEICQKFHLIIHGEKVYYDTESTTLFLHSQPLPQHHKSSRRIICDPANQEIEFGISLFSRKGNQLSLTPEGESFYKKATYILQYCNELQADYSSMSRVKPPLRIGIPPMLSTVFFPELLMAFHEKHPEIAVVLEEYGSVRACNLVQDDTLDVALVNMEQYNIDKFHNAVLANDQVVFCVSNDHKLAEKESVTTKEMSKEQLVNRLFSLESRVDAQALRTGNLSDADWEKLIEIYTTLQFVKTGKYGCFLYSSMTDKFSSSNITGIPLNPPVRIKIGMVWKKSKYISGDMLTFLHFTRMYYKEHPLIEK